MTEMCLEITALPDRKESGILCIKWISRSLFVFLAFWPILLLDCGRREELKGNVLLEVLRRRGILNCAPSERGLDECTQLVLELRESL